MNVFTFSKARNIIVVGDIHGDFNLLVYKIWSQYKLKDTLVIVAGDCGFGFERLGYYERMVRRNSKRMEDGNNWIVFVRGNHDNPAYFDGKTFMYPRFMAVPDYSLIQACGHNVLCVGGAISMDRKYRMDYLDPISRSSQQNELLARSVYWTNEAPVYDPDSLSEITSTHLIDTVVTHAAPSFCEPTIKVGLKKWVKNDEQLLLDVKAERSTLDKLFYALEEHADVRHWYYGHYHYSSQGEVNGVTFKMLDIMEFAQLY